MLLSYISSTWPSASVFRQKSVKVERRMRPGRQRTQVSEMAFDVSPGCASHPGPYSLTSDREKAGHGQVAWNTIMSSSLTKYSGSNKKLIFTKCITIIIQSIVYTSTMNHLHREGLTLCTL